MKVLISLSILKLKARVRMLFSKKSSAILTILAILFYGAIMFVSLNLDDTLAVSLFDKHGLVLLAVGYTALMVLSVMFQKRKALLFEEDSFYLFKGPFKQWQVLAYASLSNVGVAFLYGLLTVFVTSCMSMGTPLSVSTLIAIAVASMLTVLFWVQLSDALYIDSLINQRKRNVVRYLAMAVLLCPILILLWQVIQNDFVLEGALLDFLVSDAFYYIPGFGQMKLAVIGVMDGNLMQSFFGFGSLLLLYGMAMVLFLLPKPYFYEEAMQDSSEISAYYKQMRSGKSSVFALQDTKVKAVKTVKFGVGAKAIASKNFLMMKKSRSLIRGQELLILVIYFGMSIMIGNQFGMFLYMLYIFLFFLLQDSDLLKELKHYQIYLIPDHAWKKLYYAMFPSFVKISVIACAAIALAGMYYGVGLQEILLTMIQIEGFIVVFLAASVLSIRLMKARTSRIVENMVRMGLIILCALPGFACMIYMVYHAESFDIRLMEWMNYASLALNFIVSAIILFFCKDMMLSLIHI